LKYGGQIDIKGMENNIKSKLNNYMLEDRKQDVTDDKIDESYPEDFDITKQTSQQNWQMGL